MNEYQSEASETAVYPKEIGLTYTVLGLAGEAGDLCNKLKKVHRDDGGRMTTKVNDAMVDELGDVLWYLSQVALELGLPLSVVAERNLRKLHRWRR